MRIREHEGMQAMVDLKCTTDGDCRLVMSVARDGAPVWSSARRVPLYDADYSAVERTALEAAVAIADHLRRRPWRRAQPSGH